MEETKEENEMTTLQERYAEALLAYDLAPTARDQKNALVKLRAAENEMRERNNERNTPNDVSTSR